LAAFQIIEEAERETLVAYFGVAEIESELGSGIAKSCDKFTRLEYLQFQNKRQITNLQTGSSRKAASHKSEKKNINWKIISESDKNGNEAP
jgi:hypothetical protein